MASTKTSALSFAEAVLQRAAVSKHPKEQVMGELGTYAALAEKEAPGNPNSALLMRALKILEAGGSLKEAEEALLR